MIKSRILAVLICLAVPGTSSLVFANDDPKLAAIKARKAYMQVVKWNAGPLFAMAKGEMEYNAEMAAALASNLAALSGMNNSTMWVSGTDNKAYPGETRALPDIWSPDSKVSDAHQKWADSVVTLELDAGSSLDGLRNSIGDVGQGCKGCHDDYRADDE